MSGLNSTHLDEVEGLWIPPEFREFTAQIIFRTPRATIQHFERDGGHLDPYYGMIDESHFGTEDELYDVRNPELIPDKVSIKIQGEDPVVLTVDLAPEIRADGGNETSGRYRIVLVSCTKQKRDEPSPARLLYSASTYFRKQRAYAEAVGDEWWIQSAEHGLLHPDDEVGPYDTSADDLDDPDGWAETIATELWARRGTDAVIEVLGGSAYADPLTPHLEERGFEVHEPLRGLRIGDRMSKLDELIVRRSLA